MTTLRLKTFQSLDRVAQLHAEGTLVGDWARVGGPLVVPYYRRMVEEMVVHGIDCADNPPMWAWHGRVTLLDASMLLSEEHELRHGWATITFDAPQELVLLSEYSSWCAFLFGETGWAPDTVGPSTNAPAGDPPGRSGAVQATLPYLRREWVTAVEPLPTSGWDELDLDILV